MSDASWWYWDEIEVIASDVVMFARTFDYVFTTGGVGPTHDDVTIEAIAHGRQWRWSFTPTARMPCCSSTGPSVPCSTGEDGQCASRCSTPHGAEPAHPRPAHRLSLTFSRAFRNSSGASSIASRSAFVSCPITSAWCM